MLNFILFLIITIIAISASILAFFASKCESEYLKETVRYKFYAILFISLGIISHALGNLLSIYSGNIIEILLEGIAHFMVMIGFLYFYYTAKSAVENTRGLWFG